MKLLVATATTHTHIRCWTTRLFFMGRDLSPATVIGIQVSVVRSEFSEWDAVAPGREVL